MQVDQPGLPREQHRGQQVVRAPGHRDDVGLADLGAEGVQRVAHGAEDGQRPGPRLVQLHRLRRERPPPGELLAQQVEAVRPGQVRVAPGQLAEPVEQLGRARGGGRRRARARRAWRGAGRTSRPCGSAGPSARAPRATPGGSPASRASAAGRRAARRCPGSRGRAGAPRRPRSAPGCGASLSCMQRPLSRYGSSALIRRTRGSRSGSASRSRAMLASSSSLAPTSCCDDDRSCIRSSTIAARSRSACPCCSTSTSWVTCGGHVRVAVPVAADPAAERQRPGVRRQLDARARRAGRPAPRARRRRRAASARRGSRPRCGPRPAAPAGPAAARRSARAGR